MKKCSYCGFENDDKARYCSDCESSLDEIGRSIPTRTELDHAIPWTTKQREIDRKLLRYCRIIGHVAAVLAVLSFSRAAFIYGTDELSPIKSFVLVFFLFGWFLVIPVSSFSWKLMPPSKLRQFTVAWNSFVSTAVFPPIMIIALVWMTFSSWKHAENEIGLKQAIHDIRHHSQGE